LDGHQFDTFTRLFAAGASRRKALRAVAALGAIGLWRRPAGAVPAAQYCPDWLTYCPDSGDCVDLSSDLDNCGACGSVCTSGLVAVECQDGECVRANTNCDSGLTFCGPVIGCVDLSSDMDNCGGCGDVCESGLVAVTCSGGECVRAY
jgi:hypothetical protein